MLPNHQNPNQMEHKTDHWPNLDQTVLFYLTNIPIDSWTPNDRLKYAYLYMKNNPGDSVYFGVFTQTLEKHTGAVVDYRLWIWQNDFVVDYKNLTGIHEIFRQQFSVN